MRIGQNYYFIEFFYHQSFSGKKSGELEKKNFGPKNWHEPQNGDSGGLRVYVVKPLGSK